MSVIKCFLLLFCCLQFSCMAKRGVTEHLFFNIFGFAVWCLVQNDTVKMAVMKCFESSLLFSNLVLEQLG